ncbi:MAG: YraN family protein [Rickettsiales bacterium]
MPAEYAALAYLTLKCYRLVAMRYKTGGGEIDLIMRRRKTILFVEVKARPPMMRPPSPSTAKINRV